MGAETVTTRRVGGLAKSGTAALALAATMALLLAVLVLAQRLESLSARVAALQEDVGEVYRESQAALAKARAQHARHVRELEARRKDADLCHLGIQTIARSLKAVAASCPGRVWPPAWDRVQEIAGARPGDNDGTD